MGVPAFFTWLTRKYPSVVVYCVEEHNGTGEDAVNTREPNPNGVEFDNLYIDMNGVIHPCTHPENGPVPKNEDEMMEAIFNYIDQLFSIVRPRKLVYMAVDGVAPRAKMNQQRSRRFRAAKERDENYRQITKTRAELEAKGARLPPHKERCDHFDSNCITPGTAFMSRLSVCLNHYIHEKLDSDAGWKGLKVILSDANVPGEGEHKIMDFIRRQRGREGYDPNTRHCLCGADADLIMLGLATHEPNFTIIRLEFITPQSKCGICGCVEHDTKDCKGLPDPNEDMSYGSSSASPPPHFAPKHLFVRINVLREYLEEELKMSDIPFQYDFERAIDDWVFMCFFVGNDFLPHLPSLDIREGAIDRLVRLYKKNIYRTNGFLTDSGDVNFARVQVILNELGQAEDDIFKQRGNNEKNRRRIQRRQSHFQRTVQSENPEPLDEVRLWEDGYKQRYYEQKFNMDPNNIAARHRIGAEYARGLSWVLKYYYQGCASWTWFFPYHYAPFSSDMVNLCSIPNDFPTNTEPFTPLEQLMAVFPAASRSLVPSTWADLMVNPSSPIIDFYPSDFMIDLNNKRFAWQGVALLPFVDEIRLKRALAAVYPLLTEEEVQRNRRDLDRLYVSNEADCYKFLLKFKKESTNSSIELRANGFSGIISVRNTDDIQTSSDMNSDPKVLCVYFHDPAYPEGYKFIAGKLPGARDPPRTRGTDTAQNYKPRWRHWPRNSRQSRENETQLKTAENLAGQKRKVMRIEEEVKKKRKLVIEISD